MIMQMSIYYQKEDEYILEKIEFLAKLERRSKSAMILAILEEYFEAGKRIGEILQDTKAITAMDLREVLAIQKEGKTKKLIGEIMVEKKFIDVSQLDRALVLQNSLNYSKEALSNE